MKNNTDDCGNEMIELMIFRMRIKIPLVKKSHSQGSKWNKDLRMPAHP